ncbi:MAG TPA: hypothetical protein VFD32_14010 [Dehalococcoidia bacterium]|nr:hypothetical protein [Dehalococcoidia bacterium]
MQTAQTNRTDRRRRGIRTAKVRRAAPYVVIVALALTLAACSGGSAKPANSGPSATPAAVAVATGSGGATPAATAGVAPIFAVPGAEPTPAPPGRGSARATPAASAVAGMGRRPVAINAQQVVQAFQRRGIPIGQVQNLSADDDPEHLLGTAGGYTSKSVFADSRIANGASASLQAGGAVEFFADPRAAQRRFARLQAAQKGSAQPEWLFHDGDVVVRLSPALKADQASEYEISARQALAGR